MAKGEKVNTEQFCQLEREVSGIKDSVGKLEGIVEKGNSKLWDLEKETTKQYNSLDKEVSMIKYGMAILLAVGFLKTCGDGNILQNKQSYVQPQVYIITPQDNESYRKQFESLQEKLKSFEGKNESYKEGEKK